MPAHKRTEQNGAPRIGASEIGASKEPAPPQAREREPVKPAEETRDPYEVYEPPEMPLTSEEEYRVDPYKDPFRDYTYWLKHQEALKKQKP